MPDVKSNALLPHGEENGLSWIAGELVEEGALRRPKRLRAVLGIIDARRVNVDSDNGQELVTIRFKRVELLLPADLPAAEKLIRRALEARSGQTTLPLDLEDEIAQAFADMADPESPIDPDEPIDLVPGDAGPGGGDEDDEDDDDEDDDPDHRKPGGPDPGWDDVPAWGGPGEEDADDPPRRRRSHITPEILRMVLDLYNGQGIEAVMREMDCSERNARRLVARARKEL